MRGHGAVKCARNGQRAMSKLPLPYSRGPPGLPDVLLVMDDMDMVPKERSPSQGRRGTLFAAAGRGAGENCIAVSGCQRGKRGRRPVSKVWLAHRDNDRHPRTQGQPKLKAAPIFEAAGEAHSAHKADHSEVGRKVPAGQRGRVVMHPPDVFLWHAATRRAENHMQVCGQRVRCPPHSSTNPMRRRMASSLLISRRCPCVHADAAREKNEKKDREEPKQQSFPGDGNPLNGHRSRAGTKGRFPENEVPVGPGQGAPWCTARRHSQPPPPPAINYKSIMNEAKGPAHPLPWLSRSSQPLLAYTGPGCV